MQSALKDAGLSSPANWTEMRWDAVDITATWSEGESYRNIHGWVVGDWPAFSLRFEGAAWEDDEKDLCRRVVFFSGPATSVKVVGGGSAQPKIEIPNREGLVKDVQGFVAQVRNAQQLKAAPWDHRLPPRPEPHFTPQT